MISSSSLLAVHNTATYGGNGTISAEVPGQLPSKGAQAVACDPQPCCSVKADPGPDDAVPGRCGVNRDGLVTASGESTSGSSAGNTYRWKLAVFASHESTASLQADFANKSFLEETSGSWLPRCPSSIEYSSKIPDDILHHHYGTLRYKFYQIFIHGECSWRWYWSIFVLLNWATAFEGLSRWTILSGQARFPGEVGRQFVLS